MVWPREWRACCPDRVTMYNGLDRYWKRILLENGHLVITWGYECAQRVRMPLRMPMVEDSILVRMLGLRIRGPENEIETWMDGRTYIHTLIYT